MASPLPIDADALRANEFPQLRNNAYLDHVGCTFPQKSQLESATAQLVGGAYGNPHSMNPSSTATANEIERVRELVLAFFNTTLEHYEVVFTSGTTGACKLLSEAFPWSTCSEFRYLNESHNSVLGIRCRAYEAGAKISVIDGKDLRLKLTRVGRLGLGIDDVESRPVVIEGGGRTVPPSPSQGAAQNAESGLVRGRGARSIEDTGGAVYKLFAYPAECNFTGRKYPLPLRQSGDSDGDADDWLVLLDASCFAGSNPLDLSKYDPDYVCVSFYKIFGHPTGLGALLVKRGRAADALRVCPRPYFGGGTVAASLSDGMYHITRRDLASSLEDGTTHFQGILALPHGLAAIDRVGGMSAVQRHTFALAQNLASQLKSLKHSNGVPAVHFYGTGWTSESASCSQSEPEPESESQGAIVTFGLKRPTNEWVGSGEIDRIMSYNNVHIRSGCFCNPGACHSLLGLSHSNVRDNVEVHGVVCWDQDGGGLIGGRPIGACRASMGYMTTQSDIDSLVRVVKKHWVDAGPVRPAGVGATAAVAATATSVVSQIMVYPIKSCGPFMPAAWPFTSQGFAFDREWVVVGGDHTPLIQKKARILALVRPVIDTEPDARILALHGPDMPRLTIPLDAAVPVEGEMGEVRGEHAFVYGGGIRRWFTRLCRRPATLARFVPVSVPGPSGGVSESVSITIRYSACESASMVSVPSAALLTAYSWSIILATSSAISSGFPITTCVAMSAVWHAIPSITAPISRLDASADLISSRTGPISARSGASSSISSSAGAAAGSMPRSASTSTSAGTANAALAPASAAACAVAVGSPSLAFALAAALFLLRAAFPMEWCLI